MKLGNWYQGVIILVFTLYMLNINYDSNYKLLYVSSIQQIFFSDFYVPGAVLSSDDRAIKITNIATVVEVTF